MSTSYRLFKWVSYAEGISFLVLLLIAMPLKYMVDIPEPVTVIGMIHGVLFAAYVAGIAWMTILHRWRLVWALGALAAAFLPFGPFVFEAFLKRKWAS
ncbi:DUF3817 domain-containing protein [Cohnella algarum]|uniref:DUF3817 domain-containing protein n=1 Tax=Cohnella algarum TaxID=2044859 RepID=UPI0019684694|nr:DUF3817 domain-containing protein [Cohnella algarum]MBN2981509.1 DUF3817 domain-containing protein [Cohnella algarum]